MMNRFMTGVMTIGFLAACGQAQQGTSSVKADVEAISALMQEEIAAFLADDLEWLLSLRTSDVVEMEPGNMPLIGKDAVRAAWDTDSVYTTEVTQYTEDEVRVVGDWGFLRGSFTWKMTPVGGGEPVNYRGKLIWIVQRQSDGSWKMAREIWNSNEPPASG